MVILILFLLTDSQKDFTVVDSIFENRYRINGAFEKAENILDSLLAISDKKDDVYWRLSLLYYKRGYVEKNKKLKLKFYEKGIAYGDSGREINPDNLDAAFWYAANKGSVGELKGVMNSLYMVGELKSIGNEILKRDKDNIVARILLANIYVALPGLMGGSADKAIKLLNDALEIDSCFTAVYVPLAEANLKKKKKEKAKEVIQRLLSLKSYTHPGDYFLEDKPEAESLLKKIK